jgi:hypothetical protein
MVEKLVAWVRIEYIRYHPHPSATDKKAAQRIGRLKGEKLERALIDELILRHTVGIASYQECTNQATTTALVSACQAGVDRQTAERQQLQTWRCDLYGVCPGE